MLPPSRPTYDGVGDPETERIVDSTRTALDRDPVRVEVDRGDDVAARRDRFDELEDQGRRISVGSPEVVVGLRSGAMRPGPVLDQIDPPRSQQREEGLESRLQALEDMGRVVDDEIGRPCEAADRKVEDDPAIGLVDPPDRLHRARHRVPLGPGCELRAVGALGKVESDVPSRTEDLIPEGHAATLPDPHLQDSLRLEPRPQLEEIPQAFDERSLLEEAQLPLRQIRSRPHLFETKDLAVEDHPVVFPDDARPDGVRRVHPGASTGFFHRRASSHRLAKMGTRGAPSC